MDSRLIRARVYTKKPLLLKDFLLDELGSCSSNGFRSFPRRQCCSSIPFINELDLSNKHMKNRLSFNKSVAESAFSAFRSVFAAVKRLPFPTAGLKSPEKKKLKYSFLPRSFSTLKTSGFWKRKSPPRKEIERWKSFDQLLKEDSNRSSGSYRWPASVGRFTVAAECSSSDGSYDMVLDGTVTAVTADDANDVVETKEAYDSRGVVATNDDILVESTTTSDASVGTNSPTNLKKQCASEEKEQFSPMSVLDCPFDDDEEISSPFQQRLARMEGTKKKLMKKIHMFESLAKIEPLNLATRYATNPDLDEESSAIDEKSISNVDHQREDDEKIEINEGIEGKATDLLCLIKATLPSYNDLKLNLDALLIDFFKEVLLLDNGVGPLFDEGLLDEARDWIRNKGPDEKVLNWEVMKNRNSYVKNMEKGGEWKSLEEEIKEIAFMLESEVFAALLDEVLVDILV